MCDVPCPESLRCNGDKILAYINQLKDQRDDLIRIIKRQEEEKSNVNIQIERLAYKLNQITKSLAQRMVARKRYDDAILEAEEYYTKLVNSSEALLRAIQKDFNVLDESMDKKVGPDVLPDRSCKPCGRNPCAKFV